LSGFPELANPSMSIGPDHPHPAHPG
jgi:hypothetical protein